MAEKRSLGRAGARLGERNGHEAFPEACWRSPGASTGSATGHWPALRQAQGPAGNDVGEIPEHPQPLIVLPPFVVLFFGNSGLLFIFVRL